MNQPPNELVDVFQRVPSTKRSWPRWVKVAAALMLLFAVSAWWLRQTSVGVTRRLDCNCRLKQISLAMFNYHEVYGSFPPAFVLGPDGQKWHSWRVLVLPYLDQKKLYSEYRFDEPWDGPNNRKLLAKMPEVFACPSQPCPPKQAVVLSIGVLACSGGPSVNSGFTSYSVVLGQDCAFRGARPVHRDEITDGLAHTLLVGECTRTTIPWTKPDDIDIAFHAKLGDPDGFGSPHSPGAGVNFGMADCRVEFLSTSLPQTTVDALFTRNGGEPIYGY